MAPYSLLPLTPDTMRRFRQEIVVNLPALTKHSIASKIAATLPTHGAPLSFGAAFEALRLFRQMTREGFDSTTDSEKNHLAELEVEWCLELLDRLPNGEESNE